MANIAVGMSGGVDSAAAAYLLKQQGHNVTGVTLRTWNSGEGDDSRCCEIDTARETARYLGIDYHVFNCVEQFRREVIEPFMECYISGQTPDPCVECNRYVKFERLLYAANVLGAEYIATGHYASVVRLENGRYTVKKASDDGKDQSYMLCRLTQEQLSRTVLPLGELTKDEVRATAARAGLPSADAKDSLEICFVTEGSYTDYIRARRPDAPSGGNFVDTDGNILGRHKGIINYTVGQRKGLGLALGYPAYVKEIRAGSGEVVISGESGLYRSELTCRGVNYMGVPEPAAGESFRARVKIRYRHGGEEAAVYCTAPGEARIVFDRPVRAAAPGQSAVFYDGGGMILGSGVIV